MINPDDVLNLIRKNIARANGDNPLRMSASEIMIVLTDLFERLDEHLTAGGDLPRDWAALRSVSAPWAAQNPRVGRQTPPGQGTAPSGPQKAG